MEQEKIRQYPRLVVCCFKCFRTEEFVCEFTTLELKVPTGWINESSGMVCNNCQKLCYCEILEGEKFTLKVDRFNHDACGKILSTLRLRCNDST